MKKHVVLIQTKNCISFFQLKCFKFFQVIKIFLDPKSIEKVNFVYQKDEESMKVMYKYIDLEVLPVEFGGKNNVVYNHEEYSELMIQDDIKTANFWAVDAKTDHANSAINGTLVPEVAPQPSLLAAKASWRVSALYEQIEIGGVTESREK